MGKKELPNNSRKPKGGVSYSKNSFVVNESLVFQITFCDDNVVTLAEMPLATRLLFGK